jgi:benzoyl-CoA reductase/2-hydroxyglutaryl-CoA dehydratase subunit BcrC/BadD/HgdB
MVTRPDLAFAVSQVSQFMHAPRSTYVEAIDRILRYLKNTRKRNIDEKKYISNNICGYTDTDWAGIFDRKFTTGYCTFVYGNIVTCKSKIIKYRSKIERRS